MLFRSPALTTISQNIPLRGKTAVAMLHNLVENRGECGSVLLPVELIERESVIRNGKTDNELFVE